MIRQIAPKFGSVYPAMNAQPSFTGMNVYTDTAMSMPPEPLADLAAAVVEEQRVLEVAHEGLGARDVDHLAAPGRLPPVKRGQRRHARPTRPGRRR